NASSRRMLSMQALAWRVIVREVETAEAALHLIRRGERFDLAILDMQIPELDALQLAREIRQHRSKEGLPPVLCVSLGWREEKTVTAEFVSLLYKPVRQTQLL